MVPNALLVAVSFLATFLFVSCNEPPYDPSLYRIPLYDFKTQTYSLIEHPYIFEDLGLKLESLAVRKYKNKLIVKASIDGKTNSYNNNYFLFLHGYVNEGDKLLNMDLNLQENSKGKLLFSKTFDSIPTSFREIRFGLTNPTTKQRVFSVAVKEIDLKGLYED